MESYYQITQKIIGTDKQTQLVVYAILFYHMYISQYFVPFH